MNTKATATALTAIVLSATAAFAGADIAHFDTNGDRFVTFEELVRAAPDATRSDFTAIDRNGDRRISANEFAGARVQAIVSRSDIGGRQTGTGPLRLAPLQVADVDTDRNGLVSFKELSRTDTPPLARLRGF